MKILSIKRRGRNILVNIDTGIIDPETRKQIIVSFEIDSNVSDDELRKHLLQHLKIAREIYSKPKEDINLVEKIRSKLEKIMLEVMGDAGKDSI